jgi:hypothetical protein
MQPSKFLCDGHRKYLDRPAFVAENCAVLFNLNPTTAIPLPLVSLATANNY